MASYTRQTIGILIAALVAAVLVLVLAPATQGVAQDEGGVLKGKGTATDQASREEAFKKLADAQAALARAAENTGPPDFRIDYDPEGNPYVPGELIVAYEEGVSSSAVSSMNQEAEARVDLNMPKLDSAVLSFPEVKNERAQEAREAALERKREKLEQEPGVVSADYNYLAELDPEPARLMSRVPCQPIRTRTCSRVSGTKQPPLMR